jgi:gas vesicle protein
MKDAGLSFIAGLGVGAVLGLLFAPQSGEETQEFFASRARKGTNRASAAAKRARVRTENFAQQAKEQAAEAIDAGKEAYSEQKTEG